MALRTPYDYNGDGFSDVRWANSATSQEVIWNIQNDQFVSQQTVTYDLFGQPGTGFIPPSSPQAGDFNANGTTDLFVWKPFAPFTGQTEIWLYQNDQVSAIIPGPSAAFGTGWFPRIAGDYNGDGDADVFWHNDLTNQNLIWHYENGQFVAQTNLPNSTAEWTISPWGSGDFNGDGTYDVLWRNDTTNQNLIWLLQNGQFVAQSNLPNSDETQWDFYGAGDFNGDGTSDLLWHNLATNANLAWQINNAQFVSQSNLPATVAGWIAPEIGNFDRDATSELFWRNGPTGQNVIWDINNFAFATQVNQPMAANPPWFIEHDFFLNV
jgi:hypothetical protein